MIKTSMVKNVMMVIIIIVDPPEDSMGKTLNFLFICNQVQGSHFLISSARLREFSRFRA